MTDATGQTGSGIIRVDHNRENPYTMVHNSIVNNAKLSWEARGMLVYLLSKPNDWTVRFTDLVRQSSSGSSKTRRIFKELEAAGHIVRTRASVNGVFVWTSIVYEVPIEDESADTICRKPPDGSPPDEDKPSDARPSNTQPSSGFLSHGKPIDILSTDPPSTDLPNTDLLIEDVPTGTSPPAKNPARKEKKRSRGVPPPKAIQLIHEIRGKKYTIDSILWPELAATIGKITLEKEKLLRECWVEWRMRGYNPMSLKWVDDWFVQGGPTTAYTKKIPQVVADDYSDGRDDSDKPIDWA